MPGYTTPFDWESFLISLYGDSSGLPAVDSQGEATNSYGSLTQGETDLFGSFSTPRTDTGKGFNWASFASEALRGFGKLKEQKNFAPKLETGSVARLQTGGHRAQYQPTRVQDFSLQGLSGLIPRNPLVPR